MRFVSFLLFACLVGSLASTVVRAQSEHPISTCEELQDMRYAPTANFYLANDIDCSGTRHWNNGEGFVPIGTSSQSFQGTLDGKGHTITGLYIHRPSLLYASMLGYTRGSVFDLTVQNAYVQGRDSVAILAGGMGTTSSQIINVRVHGTVIGADNGIGALSGTGRGTFVNCHADAYVQGDRYVGVLIGSLSSGAIRDCSAHGSVVASRDVGGAIGYLASGEYVTRTYSTANVTATYRDIGGLIGRIGSNYIEVTDCYAIGRVQGGTNVGGLVGDGYRADVRRCYAAAEVSGETNVGGLFGEFGQEVPYSYWNKDIFPFSPVGEGKTDAEMRQRATFETWNFDIFWDITEGVSYPFLRT